VKENPGWPPVAWMLFTALWLLPALYTVARDTTRTIWHYIKTREWIFAESSKNDGNKTRNTKANRKRILHR
jgi:hypothetical protein